MRSGGKSSAESVSSPSRLSAAVLPNRKPGTEVKPLADATKPKRKHPMNKDLILGVSVSVGGGKDFTKKCDKGITCDQYVTHNAEAMFKMLFWKAVFVGIGTGYHNIKGKVDAYNLSSTTLTAGLHILFSRYFDVMFVGKLGALAGRQRGHAKTKGGVYWSAGAGLAIPYRPRHAIYRFIVGARYDNYRLIDLATSDKDIRSISLFAGVTAMY